MLSAPWHIPRREVRAASLEGETCDSVAPRPVSSLGRKQPIHSQCETGLLPAFCSVSLFNQSLVRIQEGIRYALLSLPRIFQGLGQRVFSTSRRLLHIRYWVFQCHSYITSTKTAHPHPKTSHAKYCISSFPLFTPKKRQGFLLGYSETCRPTKMHTSQNFSLTSKCKTVRPLV